jgi:hypothetical protein
MLRFALIGVYRALLMLALPWTRAGLSLELISAGIITDYLSIS